MHFWQKNEDMHFEGFAKTWFSDFLIKSLEQVPLLEKETQGTAGLLVQIMFKLTSCSCTLLSSHGKREYSELVDDVTVLHKPLQTNLKSSTFNSLYLQNILSFV